jgi:hypothetical protein
VFSDDACCFLYNASKQAEHEQQINQMVAGPSEPITDLFLLPRRLRDIPYRSFPRLRRGGESVVGTAGVVAALPW